MAKKKEKGGYYNKNEYLCTAQTGVRASECDHTAADHGGTHASEAGTRQNGHLVTMRVKEFYNKH